MKLIFAHDHMFYRYQNKIYSNGGLGKNVLKRYVNVFGDVRLLTRQKVIQDLDGKLTEASGDSISFVDVPNFKSINNYKNIFRAKKIIEEEIKNTEYLVARLPSSIGNLAIKYAKKYNKPYLVEVVGCAFDALWNYGSIVGKILAPFEYLKMKRLVKDSKYTVYVTKEYLQKKYPTNGISENCSNVNINKVEDTILEKRLQKIDEMQSPYIFGMIGALTSKYKGFDIAIKALSLLKKEGIDFELRILGKGDSSYIINLAKKYNIEGNIEFSGTLPAGEPVLNWIDDIDLYLHPSKTEGLPRALIEAMSRGCPCIGSSVGGIPELIKDSELFKNKDFKEMSVKILELIKNKEKLIDSCLRNYQNSKSYLLVELENKRNKFLEIFREGTL